jgi:indolepyruvate ferredoxin oxidoreductase
LRALRGTWFDPFGHTTERRMERALARDYEQMIRQLLGRLDAGNLGRVVEVAAVAERIRGFGPVKQRSVEAAQAQWKTLLQTL